MGGLLLVLLAAGPSPHPSPLPAANEIALGVVAIAGDRRSPEFLEYRDVPRGVTLPAFRLSGRAAGFDYDVSGRDAGQDDQRYRARLGRGGLDIRGRLDDLPHRLGDGRTMFGQGAPGVFPVAGALQRSAQVRSTSARRRGRPSTTRSSPPSPPISFAAGGT